MERRCVLVSVLLCICMTATDNYFAYHAPSAVGSLYESTYHLNTKEFGALFTIYSAPNILLVFFSGLIIDSYGLRHSSLFFNSLMLVGMLTCALTPLPGPSFSQSASFCMLLLGRFLLGLGGESLCTATSAMTAKWFKKSGYINSATACTQAFVQLVGSSGAFIVLPRMPSITAGQWVTVGVCVISLTANLVYNIFDANFDTLNPALGQYEAIDESSSSSKDRLQIESTSSSSSSSVETPNQHVELVGADVIAISKESNYKTVDQSNTSPVASTGLGAVLSSFSSHFWILLVHIGCVNPILYTFTAFGPLYLQDTFPSQLSDPKDAGDAISGLYLAIMAAPLSGALMDRFGHSAGAREMVQFLATSVIASLFLLLQWHWVPPRAGLAMLGLAFSVTKSNGPALVALLVAPERTGAAYGLVACTSSLALLIEPAAVGWIREQSGSFATCTYLFAGLSGMGALSALWLFLRTKED